MKLILTVALKQANKQQQNPPKDWTYINSVFLQLYNLIPIIQVHLDPGTSFPTREFGDKKIATFELGPEFKLRGLSLLPFFNLTSCITLSLPPFPLQLNGNAKSHQP